MHELIEKTQKLFAIQFYIIRPNFAQGFSQLILDEDTTDHTLLNLLLHYYPCHSNSKK